MATFDANDPSLNHVISDNTITQNKAGLLGAYAAGFLNDVFGIVAFVWPLILGATSVVFLSSAQRFDWWRWTGFFLLTLCFLLLSAALDFAIGDLVGGGMVGAALYKSSIFFLSPIGATLLWFFVFLVGVQLVANISWLDLTKNLIAKVAQKISNAQAYEHVEKATSDKDNVTDYLCFFKQLFSLEKLKTYLGNIPQNKEPIPELIENISPTVCQTENDQEEKIIDCITQKAAQDTHISLSTEELPTEVLPPEEKLAHFPKLSCKPEKVTNHPSQLVFPDIALLTDSKDSVAFDHAKIKAMGQALMSCLKDFSVEAELVRSTPGPVVTLFEILPARGTRVNKIANLGDDLKRSLKTSDIRILAPVPNSDTVGIEIPNAKRESVSFKELAATESFKKGCGPLTIILGKDTAGRPYLHDLTSMPHMLIAGATGQGKSVCLNSILASFLFRVHPDNLKLLLIDPKRVEFSVYADEPHLVHPVVTEIEDAKNALLWAIQEMENRFKALASLGARNIGEYNRRLSDSKNLPPDYADLKPLPYLVIVIDELADLMLTARKEVEGSLVRLAQLARAAGIHMILATQRPSHDVVTGLIKANFPCRISFKVSVRFDSRTILDQDGAEKLVGLGDMLFKSGSGKIERLHGPFLKDEDVACLVGHWKRQMAPSYKIDFSQWANGSPDTLEMENNGGNAHGDALYAEVQAFVIEQRTASISKIQRRFQIGFNRAARMVEQLEEDGIIGPANGSKPRTIVR